MRRLLSVAAILGIGVLFHGWLNPLAAQGTLPGLRPCYGTPHTDADQQPAEPGSPMGADDHWRPDAGGLAAGPGAGDCGSLFSCQPERFWIRSDYLMWWVSGARLPPLVTGSPPGTPQSEAGVLGAPGTTILFGDSIVGDQMRSGIRVRMGVPLIGCSGWSLEGDYFSVGRQSAGYDSGPRNDSPIISRPYFDLLPRDQSGQPIPGRGPQSAAELVSYPGILIGKVSVDYHDYFQSAGFWARRNLYCWGADSCGDPCSRVARRIDLIAGYRYYNLSDGTTIREDLVSGPQGAAPGTAFLIEDSFRARNDFHGSEVGFVAEASGGRWSFEMLAKVALGNNHQSVTVNGSTSITSPGQPAEVFGEGIYAGRTNIGTYQRDRFVMVPQFGVEIGYQWTGNFRTFLGYNVLYWPEVMRSADQIDLNLDTGNFPPSVDPSLPYPAFPGLSSGFWAQGVNLGAELHF